LKFILLYSKISFHINRRSIIRQHEHKQQKISPHCSHGQLRNFGIEVYFTGSNIMGKGSFAQHAGPGAGAGAGELI
jgi:hypothetical protein